MHCVCECKYGNKTQTSQERFIFRSKLGNLNTSNWSVDQEPYNSTPRPSGTERLLCEHKTQHLLLMWTRVYLFSLVVKTETYIKKAQNTLPQSQLSEDQVSKTRDPAITGVLSEPRHAYLSRPYRLPNLKST